MDTTQISISIFADRYSFNKLNRYAACKMYAGQEKTESEWETELKNKFHFIEKKKVVIAEQPIVEEFVAPIEKKKVTTNKKNK